MDNSFALEIAKQFSLEGKIKSVSSFGNGHINKTFLIKANKRYILQEINSYVFKDVDTLMNNIEVVTSFLSKKNVNTLHLVKSLDGKNFIKVDGHYFRVFEYIENSKCYETILGNNELVKTTGKSFARFHKELDSLNPELIRDVIPNFHNTLKRYNDFLDALDKADEEKKENALKEIEAINFYKVKYSLLVDKLSNREISEHIIHGDPKINNILFDKDTDEVLCIVDLDTIMKGTYLYDIGDAYRTLFTGEYEDTTDLGNIRVDLDIYSSYLEGYLSEMKDILSLEEISLIPFSAFLLTIEVGIRFLEDYLRGNVYYHVEYEEHNLVRSRTQLKLANQIYNSLSILNDVTMDIYRRMK